MSDEPLKLAVLPPADVVVFIDEEIAAMPKLVPIESLASWRMVAEQLATAIRPIPIETVRDAIAIRSALAAFDALKETQTDG